MLRSSGPSSALNRQVIFVKNSDPARPVIAIIGAGASGTLLAWRLWKVGVAARGVVIGDGLEPALGLAYGTRCSSHFLNVCASGMSAMAEDSEHFLHWAQCHYDPDV
ncbi:putative oxidoreductase [Gluconobacter thailandicus NBRC 3257]|uniref:Oxidoreductase n=1 Tax=Gluconobacter thailandicus NBRC 3257 TaxID=1381097 RepID=A0ABQ0IV00_GLUTH|nr:oxidoreductase [Gluconobacter thailandicus]GAC86469.1 putative oxidoreductase [Gluconobacter thailandicus NBRC 3255]GAD26030.1 putative oxidoreductase [Gluconobacter thailandicus NBRC 3257]